VLIPSSRSLDRVFDVLDLVDSTLSTALDFFDAPDIDRLDDVGASPDRWKSDAGLSHFMPGAAISESPSISTGLLQGFVDQCMPSQPPIE